MKEFLNKLSAKENRTALLLVSVAVIGILIFILTSATFPFKDLLFNRLFPKPPSKAATQFPNDPEKGPIFDGPVNTVYATNTEAYLGGSFTFVGPNTGWGGPINISDGTRVSNYPIIYGAVWAAVADGNDGWYVGGNF